MKKGNTICRHNDQYYLALVAVVGTIPAVIVLLLLTQRSKYAEFIRSYRGIAPNFVSVIGVLFALNLAFLANDTWSAHDRARHAVFQEAGSLRSILALAEHLPDPARSKVDRAVRNYTHSVVSTEWPMLALRQSSPAAADGRLHVGPEHLEIDDRRQPFQGIPRRRQCGIPRIHIEETPLIRHHHLRLVTEAVTQPTWQPVFRGVQLTPAPVSKASALGAIISECPGGFSGISRRCYGVD